MAAADWAETGEVRYRKSVTLGPDGGGSVSFDVRNGNERWKISTVTVGTSQLAGQAPYPSCTVFLGGQQAGLSEGKTWTGAQAVFHGSVTMGACDTLTVEFDGGVPGTIATVIIEGTSERWA